MKHHPLNRLAIVTIATIMLLAMLPSSCKQSPAEKPADTDTASVERSDSADSLAKRKETFALYYKANDLANRMETDSLEEMVPGALELCLKYGHMDRYYAIWGILGDRYVWTNQFDKAVEVAQKMQDDAIKRKDDFGIFHSYKVLGTAYAYRNNWEEAARCFEKAIDYFHDHFYNYTTNVYRLYSQSLKFLERYETLDTLLNNWGEVLEQNRPESLENDGNVWVTAKFIYHIEMVDYLMREGKYKDAVATLDSAAYYEDLTGDKTLNYMLILTYRSQLAREMEDYRKALEYSQKEVDMALELEDNGSLISAQWEKTQALKGLGHYREAFETLESLYDMRDSLRTVDSHEQLDELNKRFEVNELKMKAEREKMELERDKMQAERRQLYLVLAIILLGVLGGGLFLYYRYRSAKRLAKMRAAQERIENELKIARDIQMSMVPSMFPEREGLDMFAAMAPAKEVGGDLYGYVLQGDKLYFALGDVSGKGVPASLFMAQATRLFRTLAAQGMMPAEICTRMNDALSGDDNENGMFVTFFLGLLDLQTGHLSFCNAGHNPPVLVEQAVANSSLFTLHSSFIEMIPNAPIGLWPELEYEGEEIESIKGRALFIYTDGLNEAENTAQEQFGDERLLEMLQSTHFDTARQVIETLKAEVDKHRNGADPNDDLTMMCIRLA